MVWTPFPASLVQTIARVLSGPLQSVVWRLIVLIAGAFVVFYLVAANSSVVAYVLLFVLVAATLGAILKASARDIWNANFWRFKL